MDRRNALTKMIAALTGLAALFLPKSAASTKLPKIGIGVDKGNRSQPGLPLCCRYRPDGSRFFYVEVPHEQVEQFLAALRDSLPQKRLMVLQKPNATQIAWD